MNLYLHLKWLLECFQTDLLPQAEQSVILFTRERCRILNISLNLGIIRTVLRLRTRVNLAGTFQICFWYFISFNMKCFFLKMFQMIQTQVAPNIKIFLHNVPCIEEHDIDLEKTTT